MPMAMYISIICSLAFDISDFDFYHYPVPNTAEKISIASVSIGRSHITKPELWLLIIGSMRPNLFLCISSLVSEQENPVDVLKEYIISAPSSIATKTHFYHSATRACVLRCCRPFAMCMFNHCRAAHVDFALQKTMWEDIYFNKMDIHVFVSSTADNFVAKSASSPRYILRSHYGYSLARSLALSPLL